MSDAEDWTVVGSKSQTKKNGAGAGVSSSKEAPDKSCQGRNLVGVRIKKSPGGESLNGGRKDVRGAAANNQHGTCKGVMGPIKAASCLPVKATKCLPIKDAVGVKDEIDRASLKVQDVGSSKAALLPIKTEGAVPAPGNVDVVKSESGCNSKSQISRKLPLSPPVPVVPATCDKDNSGNSCDKKVNHNNASCQAVVQPSTSAATTSSGGTTKKKRGGKEDRRKKREEKFYQALYQNKDSHIQFVSAEVIRKLQNNDRPTVAWKTPCRTTKFTPSSFASAALPESCGAKCLLPVDDFPLLTPNKSNCAQVEDKVVTASCSDTNKPELSAESSKIEVKDEVTATPQHNQVLSTPKPSGDSLSEAPPCNVKTPAVCSSKGKKSKQPMIIDVSSLIINKKKERERDVQRKFGSSNTPFGRLGMVRRENFRVTAGNPLDSSGPGVINRGKIRQKKKKPTKLKLTILKSRALGKMLMEQQIKQEEGLESGDIKIKSEPEKSTDVIKGLSAMSLSNLPEIIDEQDAEVKVKEEKIIVESPDESTDELVENKESVNSVESDVTLKFIQLLDEVSRLKIADEGPSAEVEVAVKSCMHTRKFRDYCDMYTSKELHRHVINLLSELFRFQDRLYHTDPIKFKTKRRFVTGLKEAFTYLNLNKVQLLIIAPDIEKNPEPGGLDEKITQILTLANAKGVAYIFSSSKYNLGRPMRIKTPISIISVLDKQNCEETFKAMMEEANRLREQYRNDFMVKTKEFIAQDRIKLEQ